MKPSLPLAAFVKSLYPTHSNYLECLQAGDKFKDLTFDTLIEKIADREKAFGNKVTWERERELKPEVGSRSEAKRETFKSFRGGSVFYIF